MPADRRKTRSPLVILSLLALIAVESTGVAIARSIPVQVAVDAPAGAVANAATATAVTGAIAGVGLKPAAIEPDPLEAFRSLTSVRSATPTAAVEWITRSRIPTPAATARSESKDGKDGKTSASGDDKGGAGRSKATLTGRNRVWIPSLGIRRSVSGFACSSNAYPGNRVYRWGCAGRNNVYLFGHAHSVFKPLHDAYVRGRLKKGMKVLYADGKGKVSTYRVTWWRVVAPDKGEFAYAAQSKPSMTLQTCVGAKSQFRLVVRLVRVD